MSAVHEKWCEVEPVEASLKGEVFSSLSRLSLSASTKSQFERGAKVIVNIGARRDWGRSWVKYIEYKLRWAISGNGVLR